MTDDLTIPPRPTPLPKSVMASTAKTTKAVVSDDFDETTRVDTPIPGHIPDAQRTLTEAEGILTSFIKPLYSQMRAIVVRHLPVEKLTEEQLLKSKDFFFDSHQLDHDALSLQTVISSNPNWQYLNDEDVLRAVVNKPHLHLARGVGSNLNWQYLNHIDVTNAVSNNLNKELALGVASNPNWQDLISSNVWQTVSKNTNSLFARGVGSNINWNLLNENKVQVKVLTNQNTEFAAGVGSNPNWTHLNSDSTLKAVLAEPNTKFAEAIGANPYWRHLDDSKIMKDSKLAKAIESNPKRLLNARFDASYFRRIKSALTKLPDPDLKNHFVYKVFKDCGVDLLAV